MNVVISTAEPRTRRGAKLPEEVAGYVREQIMSGNLTPGQFLRLEPISEAVGVSITPVREALVALSNEGFVTAVPRRGFIVAPFTRQDVQDLFWAQGQLAGELAARAAKRIAPEELARLENIMDQLDAAVELGDTDEIGRLGNQFHRSINVAARSDRLARLLAGIVKHLPTHYYASIEGQLGSVPAEHKDIFAALSKRQAKRARLLAQQHIEGMADSVIDTLERRGLWLETTEK